jgi:preprotein translocase subunit SecG
MYTLVIIIHVLACIALILIVLLQKGKGADLGAAFGGASQTVFGSAGAGGFLARLTTGSAIVFMLTCLGLAYMSSHRAHETVMREVGAAEPAASGTESTGAAGPTEQKAPAAAQTGAGSPAEAGQGQGAQAGAEPSKAPQ